MMTLCVVWEGQVGNMHLTGNFLMAYARRDKSHSIEVVALEEASFLLLEKPRCLLINPVGDDIFAPVK